MSDDPTFYPGQPFNVGSNQNRAGVFERQNNAALEAMADNIQSFYDTGDTFRATVMISSTLFFLFLLTLGNLVVAAPLNKRVDCPTLHMIVARGSTEVEYDYANSEAQGVTAMAAAIAAQEEKCPGGKIALLGYSQGAHVIGDVLSSNTTAYLFYERSRLGRRDLVGSANIVAVLQFGDPSFVPSKTYDIGTASTGGWFARTDTTLLDTVYASVIRSYCDDNDLFCASGNSLEVHESYVAKYGGVAAEWIVQQAAA
ncbi:hypothetical protein JCM8547_002769 [Rhodosporidiobolus lusitaniae]